MGEDGWMDGWMNEWNDFFASLLLCCKGGRGREVIRWISHAHLQQQQG